MSLRPPIALPALSPLSAVITNSVLAFRLIIKPVKKLWLLKCQQVHFSGEGESWKQNNLTTLWPTALSCRFAAVCALVREASEEVVT